jgi:hypothetical protein
MPVEQSAIIRRAAAGHEQDVAALAKGADHPLNAPVQPDGAVKEDTEARSRPTH